MGIVMLISSVSLLFKAFRKLRFWDKWHEDHRDMDQEAATVTDWLAWWGFGIYSVQAIIRCLAGRQLRQSLVWHCFIASVVSLVYLLVLGIAALEEKEWSWKAEPIAAIALAFVTLVEGIRIVYFYFDDMDTRLQYEKRA
jgi:divalent metal cation (Fe/Co/Zn/Cd) transporter